jgi:hypothetical protein
MTQVNNCFEPLSEELRYSYLQAMDVTIWVPKEQASISFASSTESGTTAVPSKMPAETTQLNVQQINTQAQADLRKELKPELETLAAGVETAIKQIKLQEAEPTTSVNQDSNQNKKLKSYLKIVNWKSSSNGEKVLLIICRHDKNQPAQSFASPNAPSQFMSDYLQAISELLINSGIEVQIQLAHLTEAGLGSDNQAMPETVSQLAPDLILLLGDESIHHLFDANSDIAKYRSKLLDIEQLEGYSISKAIASYHPFTLIKNPALKRLAFEDLSFVVDVIKNFKA